MIKKAQPAHISTPAFYITLALALKPLHGYQIMKQAEQDSQGQVSLGPGTLYGAIKRMLQDGLIKEVDSPHPDDNDRGRRYYTLTDKGRQALNQQISHYQQALDAAQRYQHLSLAS